MITGRRSRRRVTVDGGLDARVPERPVDGDHENGHAPDLQKLARAEERVALGMSAKHPGQDPPGDGEIRRAKENPGDTNSEVSAEPEEQLDR